MTEPIRFVDEYFSASPETWETIRKLKLGGSMIEVYHNSEFLMYMTNPTFEELKKGHFEHVATVETDSIDIAYQQTNNIDQPWHLNTNVKADHRENRSTSVGDLVKKGEIFYVVQPEGWLELTREQECELTFYIPK